MRLRGVPVIALIAVGIALLCAGCTSRKRAPDAFPDPSCRLLPGVPQEAGTIVFALTDRVDPAHAPAPRNPSERIVFRNLYETLVLVDCAGQVGPGLAESWTTEEGGRVWTFTLRADARFWDGTEVRPDSIKRAWSTSRSRSTSDRRRLPWLWLDADTDSVTVLDERRLTVRLPVPVGETPVFFAHPALAVVARRPDSAFPEGTGPCRIAGSSLAGGAPGRHDLICAPNEHHTERPAGWERLVFRIRLGQDLRDLPAEGVDAFLVRDRSTERYFATVAAFDLVALPWDRIYALFSPMTGGGWPAELPGGESAREVVQSDARPASSVLFGDAADHGCADLLRFITVTYGTGIMTGRPGRILYPAEDPDARSLAERLAFLADVQGAVIELPPPAVGLSAPAIADTLRSGGDAAVVLGMERHFATDCLQLAGVLAAAEWLRASGREALSELEAGRPAGGRAAPEASIAAHLADLGALRPLVATRPHLVARRGLVGIDVDSDGALRFARAGWSEGDQLP
jgi:hypothetical protein